MEENKSYHDWLFEESEEETKIHEEINDVSDRFHQTKEYVQFTETLDSLFDKLIEAGKKRRENGKTEARKRGLRHEPKKVDLTEFKRKNEESYQKKFEGYPEPLKAAITAYNALDDGAKRVFQHDTWAYHHEYDKYENPQTTKEDLKDLLEILVQTTLDFINERGLKDIDAIGFGADSLQESAKRGEWTSSTDANIYATGMGKMKAKNGKEYAVTRLIGEYM